MFRTQVPSGARATYVPSLPETDDYSAAKHHWIYRIDKNILDAQWSVVLTWQYL